MAETAFQESEQSHHDMPVGEILRRTREHYGRTIPEVESALRIRASQIEAIEANDVSALPARVYAVGFVRSYAEYLGLDGKKMAAMYKTQSADDAEEAELHFPVMAEDRHLPPWWVTVSCVAAVMIILTVWFGQNVKDRKIINAIPPAPQIAATPVFAEPPAQKELEAPVIEEKPPEGIILNIRANSWVEIRDKSGKTMLSQVLKAGDQYYVPDRPDLTISIGNAAGVEIEVDGQVLKSLGETGKVIRRLPLDVQYLKDNFAAEQ